MKAKSFISEILLVLVTILWGLGFVFQSIGGGYLDVFSFNFCRNLLATCFIGIVLIFLFIYKKKKVQIFLHLFLNVVYCIDVYMRGFE